MKEKNKVFENYICPKKPTIVYSKNKKNKNEIIKKVSPNYILVGDKYVFNPKAFPIASNFSITMQETIALGYHLNFRDEKLGILTFFPEWDNIEDKFANMTMQHIPCGTLNKPMEIIKNKWRLLLFQYNGYMFILESDDPLADGFNRCYKVSFNIYIKEWALLISCIQKSKTF